MKSKTHLSLLFVVALFCAGLAAGLAWMFWPEPVPLLTFGTTGNAMRQERERIEADGIRDLEKTLHDIMAIDVQATGTKTCPHCRSKIDACSDVCPRCTRDMPAWAKSFPEALDKYIKRQELEIAEMRKAVQ